MPVEVLAPPLGTTVDTVTLVRWYKREGETVRAGEPLFEVETDKATMDIEAPASGILRAVSAEPGSAVKALSRLAVIAAEAEETGVQANLPEPRAAGEAPPAAGMRQLPGEPKADRVFISPRARRLAEEKQVTWKTLRGTGPEGAIVERDIRALVETAPGIKVTPLAERMAAEAGVPLGQLAGTGLGGRITREDVARHVTGSQPEKGHAEEIADREVVETIPTAGIRARIAERMVSSHLSTARVTLNSEADATALVELRASLAADGMDVSYNDLLLYVLAHALREHPRLNASLQGDSIQVWKQIHIGLAVDTERGLIVPVVRDVDRKGLSEIARETRRLIEAAQAGHSVPDDLRGGTFTLTNLGAYGIDSFTPIINLPECAILGVGRISPRPTVVEGQIVVRQMVWLSLSFDHRLADGGPAARFLQRVVALIQKPHRLLT